MSSAEQFLVQRAIRRLEHAHMHIAGVLVMVEEDLADLRKAQASDAASRAQAFDTMRERRAVPAQREARES